MIYCIHIEQYPKQSDILEENIYKDENNLEWRIVRIKEGFIVRYFGESYFQDDRFDCDLSDGQNIQVKNTNCILFKDVDFDTFYHVREVLKNGFTDDIWEVFQDLFTERLEHDSTLLESEISPPHQ